MRHLSGLGPLTFALVLALTGAASAQEARSTTAGAVLVERPTLNNLGFEWRIAGDANRNASVQLAYRKAGEAAWKTGLPLMRLQGEDTHSIFFKGAFTYVAPNMFAGSVFDLQPDTTYDVRLTLSDPDGVAGETVKTLTARTRAEPTPANGGATYHVYPFGYAGPKQEPAFTGLLQAYYIGSVGGDWYNAFPPRVKAGDVILVHAGVYKDDRAHYGHELMSGYKLCCNTTGDGTYYLTAKGTAERPIVIKAAGDGEVIFDGDGNYNLFNVQAADYNYFEGITVRNTLIAFEAGIKAIAGSSGLTIKRSKFEDIGIGVHTDWAGSKDFYIADNSFTGRHIADQFWGWAGPWAKLPGFAESSRLQSQFAVKIYGSGHVVAYNRVRNFHDGIDHATYGDPPGWPDTAPADMPSSDDIIGNDISNMHDNCIEADGGAQNIRVIGNLCVNSGGEGYSLQPLMGGPAYFIRNVLYSSPASGGIKFSENPAGGVFYNNTWFSNFAPGRGQGSNMTLRNNLLLRQYGDAPVLQMNTWTNYSSSDFNGFFAGPGGDAFAWNSPDFTVAAETRKPLVERSFKTLHDYQAATGQDLHSRLVGFGDFVKVAPIDPSAPLTALYDGAQLDVRLRKGSAAIGKGIAIPNVAEAPAGRAPDLGAVPYGAAPPHYGPR